MGYSVLITGANRGIGFALVEQYVKDGWNVLATCRRLEGTQFITERYPEVHALQLDLIDHLAIEKLPDMIKEQSVDLLINNAVYAKKEESFYDVDYDNWVKSMQVNAFSIYLLAKALRKKIKASKLKKIISISSDMHDFDLNNGNKNYCYQASKGAGQMIVRKLAKDLYVDGITVAAIHPGWVKTRLGGMDARLITTDSASNIKSTITSIDHDCTGNFFNYNGSPIDW